MRNIRALAFLRISIGVLFLTFGQYKLAGPGFIAGHGFEGWIHRFLDEGGAYPFMVPVLRDFVLAHPAPIAWLVALGETAIGVSLIVGLATRMASACGTVFMLSLLFSANYPGPHAPLWQYFGASLDHLVPALCFIAFVLGEPEGVWTWRSVLKPRTT